MAHRTWLTGNRACSFSEPIVAPGETATRRLPRPASPEGVTEEFQLVSEGVVWLPDTRFTVVTPTAVRHPVRTLHAVAGRSRRSLLRQGAAVPAAPAPAPQAVASSLGGPAPVAPTAGRSSESSGRGASR